MKSLKVIPFKKKDAPGVFKKLKGRRFVAVSISKEDQEGKNYQYHVNNMTDEEIVYAASLLMSNMFEEGEEK